MKFMLMTSLTGMIGLFGCKPGATIEASNSLLDDTALVSGTPDADAACIDIANNLETPKNAGGVMFDENCTT